MSTSREDALSAPSLDGMRELCIVHDVVWEAFVNFIYDRGLSVERMPVFTDVVPTPPDEQAPMYLIGLGARGLS